MYIFLFTHTMDTHKVNPRSCVRFASTPERSVLVVGDCKESDFLISIGYLSLLYIPFWSMSGCSRFFSKQSRLLVLFIISFCLFICLLLYLLIMIWQKPAQ